MQLPQLAEGMFPVFFGISAAIAWGFADFLVAYASSRVSSYPTLKTFAFTQPIGAAAILAITLLTSVELEMKALSSSLLLLISLLGAVSYILLYKALGSGPVSITSPIASTYGAIAAVLAIFLTGETLSELGLIASSSIVIGVVLISTHSNNDETLQPKLGQTISGAVLAIAAAVGLGSTLFFLKFIDVTISLLTAVLVMRIIGTIIGLPIIWRIGTSITRSAVLPLLSIGLLDGVAFIFYVQGIRLGRVSIVAPLGSLFAAVTVLLSVIVFKERLSRVQMIGVGCILVGVPLMAIV